MLALLLAWQIDVAQLERDYRATQPSKPGHYLMTVRAVDAEWNPLPKVRITCDGYWIYLFDKEPRKNEPIPLEWAPPFRADSLGGVTFNLGLDMDVPFRCYAWDGERRGSVLIEAVYPRMIVPIVIR